MAAALNYEQPALQLKFLEGIVEPLAQTSVLLTPIHLPSLFDW
jgi:hypothetical protein